MDFIDLDTIVESNNEICPAPPVLGAIPPTEEHLLAVKAQTQDDPNVYFSLGNVFFRRGSLDKAIALYKEALSKDDANALVLCNLGICEYFLGKYSSALKKLHRAIFCDKDLVMAHLYMGRTHMVCKEYDRARIAFRRVLKIDSQHEDANLYLAFVYDRMGDRDRAEASYKDVISCNSDNVVAKHCLCHYEFEKGLELFNSGDRADAFVVWGLAHNMYAPSFTSHKGIAQSMRELVQQYNNASSLESIIDCYSESVMSGGNQEELAYPLFCEFFFSIGLIPEVYEDREELSAQAERWQKSLDDIGDHPYPHYKLALIEAYSGAYKQCLHKLQLCFDKFPYKKHSALRLNAIHRFVSTIRDIQSTVSHLTESISSEDDWHSCEFDNRFEIEAWKKTGAEPAEAAKWRALGFSAKRTQEWREVKLSVEQAQTWDEFSDPKEVLRWIKASFEPSTAAAWKEHFSSQVDQVLLWHSAGFESPQEAAQWSGLFTFPWEAMQWRKLPINVEEAERWIQRGMTDPFTVQRFKKKRVVEVETDKVDTADSNENQVNEEVELKDESPLEKEQDTES